MEDEEQRMKADGEVVGLMVSSFISHSYRLQDAETIPSPPRGALGHTHTETRWLGFSLSTCTEPILTQSIVVVNQTVFRDCCKTLYMASPVT